MGTTSTGNFRLFVRSFVAESQVLSQFSVPFILISITYLLTENEYHIWADGHYLRGGDGQYAVPPIRSGFPDFGPDPDFFDQSGSSDRFD